MSATHKGLGLSFLESSPDFLKRSIKWKTFEKSISLRKKSIRKYLIHIFDFFFPFSRKIGVRVSVDIIVLKSSPA